MSVKNEFRDYMFKLSTGPVADFGAIELWLAALWASFSGSSEGGMRAHKLRNRTEEMEWNPPVLAFRIERHGGTVNGSTRAEVQHWEIDVDASTATLVHVGRRQVEGMARRVDVRPLADEIFSKIIAGEEDPRLKWIDDKTVRVKIGEIISSVDVKKQTLAGRRKRFREYLESRLRQEGWTSPAYNKFVKNLE